ncbi:MAG TPA: hypothetical protein VNB06_12465, partial [Thermoanaerobaculia bacterium]|nr:hypothetical protein [Thermoanaerobaculia bacterium]
NNPQDVIRWAGEALRIEPGSSEAACLLRAAAARIGDCDAVVAATLSCPGPPADVKLARQVLGCLIEREAWSEAHRVLERLPAELSAQKPIQRLARELSEASVDILALEQTSDGGAPEREGALSGTPSTAVSPAAQSNGDESREAEVKGKDDVPQRVREQFGAATTKEDFEAAFLGIKPLADQQPDDPELNLLAGEAAYRAARFAQAVRHYERVREMDGQPVHLFYFAVSLYESGNPETAARVLRRALPHLARSPFVASYVEKILPRSGGG